LLVAQEELVLPKGTFVDQLFNPLRLQPNVTVGAADIRDPPRVDLQSQGSYLFSEVAAETVEADIVRGAVKPSHFVFPNIHHADAAHRLQQFFWLLT
jgi:hypothetical protein